MLVKLVLKSQTVPSLTVISALNENYTKIVSPITNLHTFFQKCYAKLYLKPFFLLFSWRSMVILLSTELEANFVRPWQLRKVISMKPFKNSLKYFNSMLLSQNVNDILKLLHTIFVIVSWARSSFSDRQDTNIMYNYGDG